MMRELTFTTLSHPDDTITGFKTFGLKRTQDTLKTTDDKVFL